MTYSEGYPIRLVGGRLALEFINTADWSPDGQVVHEKIVTKADLEAWLNALAISPLRSKLKVSELLAYRLDLRRLLTNAGDPSILNSAQDIKVAPDSTPEHAGVEQPLQALLAVSALSILMDGRELRRLKMCPGDNCGWLFIDETKNARRNWCSMGTCGNRAKAARHYARSKNSAS